MIGSGDTCEQDSYGVCSYGFYSLVRDKNNNNNSNKEVKTQNNKIITSCSKCMVRTLGS